MTLAHLIAEGRRLVENSFERLRKHRSVAVSSFVNLMTRTSERDRKRMMSLWDEMVQAPGDREVAKASAKKLGLDWKMALFHGQRLKPGEKYPNGSELYKAATDELKRMAKTRADAPKKPFKDPRLGPRGSF